MTAMTFHDAPNRIRHVALTWPFAFSVSLLLSNDFWLKRAWPGIVSGKLSDFAGIALVTLLALATAPRHRIRVFVTIAAAFAFWKSPSSQPLIDAVNLWSPMKIGRVVDYTDLLAPAVMPACAAVAARPERFAIRGHALRRVLFPPMFAAALFGIMATTLLRLPFEYEFRLEAPGAMLERARIAEAIQAFAADEEMTCGDCADLNTHGSYSRSALDMRFTYPDVNRLKVYLTATAEGVFFFSAGADKVAAKAMRKLHRRLKKIHPDLKLEQIIEVHG